MDTKPITEAILCLLLDDAFILCNVAGALPYGRYPNESKERVRAAARKVALDMALSGWVVPLECPEHKKILELIPLPRDRYEEVLLDPRNWEEPSESPSTFWLDITPSGEQTVQRMLDGQH